MAKFGFSSFRRIKREPTGELTKEKREEQAGRLTGDGAEQAFGKDLDKLKGTHIEIENLTKVELLDKIQDIKDKIKESNNNNIRIFNTGSKLDFSNRIYLPLEKKKEVLKVYNNAYSSLQNLASKYDKNAPSLLYELLSGKKEESLRVLLTQYNEKLEGMKQDLNLMDIIKTEIISYDTYKLNLNIVGWNKEVLLKIILKKYESENDETKKNNLNSLAEILKSYSKPLNNALIKSIKNDIDKGECSL